MNHTLSESTHAAGIAPVGQIMMATYKPIAKAERQKAIHIEILFE